jgi:hypothetical protein
MFGAEDSLSGCARSCRRVDGAGAWISPEQVLRARLSSLTSRASASPDVINATAIASAGGSSRSHHGHVRGWAHIVGERRRHRRQRTDGDGLVSVGDRVVADRLCSSRWTLSTVSLKSARLNWCSA